VIPSLNRNPSYTIRIPELSGGVNWRDSVTQINDNQLTDAKNVWYKDGALRTRPTLSVPEGMDRYTSFTQETESKHIKVFSFPFNITVVDGVQYALEFVLDEHTDEWTLRYVNPNRAPIIVGDGDITDEGIAFLSSAFAIQRNNMVYLYLHGWNNGIRVHSAIAFLRGDDGSYDSIRGDDGTGITFYAPLVLTNCFPVYGDDSSLAPMLTKGATQVEGFNLLSNRYRMEVSTFDASENGYTVDVNGKNEPQDIYSYMEYGLPFTVPGCAGNVEVTYTDYNGVTYSHSASVPTGENTFAIEETQGADGYYMCVYLNGNTYRFAFSTATTNNVGGIQFGTVHKNQYVNNNMIVSAPCLNSVENEEKVFCMSKAVWYGNNATGINGGNRVFLGGNDKENEKSLVIWSDFDNPLYFPENNYAYVGDKDQAVTGFGKQGSNLIIFKENEIYSTQYTEGSVTAEELYNQSVIDITTRTAYFPMTLIHPTIGCDCPNSIQLCRNRLVFAHSTGHVYTLVSQNQYSEKNVYEVSEMVSKRLPNGDVLKDSMSSDWEGHYLLFVPIENGTDIYLMDYNSYGYTNIASYTKSDDANRLVPWYYWSLPLIIKDVLTVNNKLFLAGITFGTDSRCWLGTYTMTNGSADILGEPSGEDVLVNLIKIPVSAMLQTKYFDFSNPSVYKTIQQADVSFINNNGLPIAVDFITETGIPDSHTAQVYTDESKCFIPWTRLFTRMAIKVSCSGNMGVDGIILKYKQAGGKKWR
jgi:hypothetical protein